MSHLIKTNVSLGFYLDKCSTTAVFKFVHIEKLLYCNKQSMCIFFYLIYVTNERKSEQAHIPHAPPLLENAVYNDWQLQALVRGNRTENQFHLSYTK